MQDRLKEVGSQLARRSVPLMLRLASAGLIDDDAVQTAVGDEPALGGEDLFESYLQDKELVAEFREELEAFAGHITEEKGGPLFFFVDEMDRCRPDFALELLEHIKHLFDVPGIVFILAVDPGKLHHSIKSLYGQGMDARGYLRRFIQLEYELPPPKPGTFAHSLYNAHGLAELIRRQKTLGVLEVAAWCCEQFDFSLRAQKQYFLRLELVIRVLHQRDGWSTVPWEFLALLVAPRSGRPELYNNLRSDKTEENEAHELVRLFRQRSNEMRMGTRGKADADMLDAAFKVAYWADKDEYYAYKEEVAKKREEVRDQVETFLGPPSKRR